MSPLLLAVPMAIIEILTFYRWHWPHRNLFPERFRTLVLAKGVLKGLTLIGLTVAFSMWSSVWGWACVVGHTTFGCLYHWYCCRQHSVG